MIVKSISEIPASYVCNRCGHEKPIGEIVVVHLRKEGVYLIRRRCKDCNNRKERGHRREWKRRYLRRWRRENPKLNESYWRKASADKTKVNTHARAHFKNNHHAILIQGRLRRRLGMHVTLNEARSLVSEYGPCYPSMQGLSRKGINQCEQIRSRLRHRGIRPNLVEIRMMVYADGYYIKPRKQKIPYQYAAENLRRWWKTSTERRRLNGQICDRGE
jgi:hypothetical protein